MLKYTEQYLKHKLEINITEGMINAEIRKREDRIKRAEKQIEKLRKKLYNKDRYVSWVDEILVPLMHDLEKLAGEEWKGEIFGPFGMSCRASIYLCKDTDLSISKQDTYSLTVTPPNCDGVLKYETGEKTDQYEPGSIGDLNGFNWVTAELPDTVEEIWQLMRFSGAIRKVNE